MNVNKFIEELKDVLKDKLEMVFVYGSKTGIPTYNLKEGADLMIVVQDLSAEDLKNCVKPVYKWTRKNSVPVFMSVAEWFSSTDVYPMEYTDIKENHHILYGGDLVSSIEIKSGDLRLQCEREAKNMLMRFRKEYLLNARNKRVMTELLISSYKTAIVILKTILRLKNLPAGTNAGETICSAAKLGVIDGDFFKELALFKENKKKPADIGSAARHFIDEADKILKYTDKM